jgi:aryl-alcohol dehydrogenase-like predicted oxidoreductase
VKTRPVGRSGLAVSEICLGTMTFGVQCDERLSFAILDKSAEAGINFLDAADVYPIPMKLETLGITEAILGRWLKGKRDKFVVATKCFFPTGPGPKERGNSRQHVQEALEASLRRLQTDCVDLYQVHAFDPETPLDETLRALDDATRAGKIRHAGCSNFLAWEMAKAGSEADRLGIEGFVCTQPRYNALHRDIELDLLPLCADRGIGVIVFNPLAGGLLTGKHRPGAKPEAGGRFSDQLGDTAVVYRKRYWHEESLQAIAALNAFFEKRDRCLTAASVAWVLRRPEITSAIVGASKLDQLDATLKAPLITLDAEELAALDQLWFDLPRQRPATGPVR